MLMFILLWPAITCALAAAVSGYWPSPSNGRIVGGEETTIEGSPFVVSLQFLGSHLCGAIILNNKYVLSAGHCAIVEKLVYFSVRAGSSSSNNSGVVLPVDFMKVHEQYNAKTLVNDISIFRVGMPFEFGGKIQPIPLPTAEPVNGSPAKVFGYGVTLSGGRRPSNALRVAEVHTVGTKECRSSPYKYGSQIKDNMLCAVGKGKDSCQGDSGGPLVVGGKVIGIVSWGYGCARSDYPGVYTNVFAYITWIKDIIETH